LRIRGECRQIHEAGSMQNVSVTELSLEVCRSAFVRLGNEAGPPPTA
jgi:hypothetical protein